MGEIAVAMEQMLQNLNTLNRSLEGVIAVGKEFESVSTLWKEFHGVLGREEAHTTDANRVTR